MGMAYKERRAAGLCASDCCKTPPVSGKSMCEYHLNVAARRSRKSYTPEKRRNRHYIATYSLNAQEVEALLEAQGGVCAICKTGGGGKPFHVDHDHNTGVVRGLLCHHCNVGLGHFKDSTGLLAMAIAYLEAHS